MATKAETKPITVMGKLALARLRFLEGSVKKSGKNMSLEFLYFELSDIVPNATRIFADIGLLGVVNFTADTASMRVYDTENMTDFVEFTVPLRELEQIISNSGKVVTNAIQAMGSTITYYRRYLYMLALDIVEADEIDATAKPDAPAPVTADTAPVASAPAKPQKPVTPQKREEIKQELVNADGQADELQVSALKAACKQLLATDEKQNDFVQKIAMKTNGFTVVTKSACEALIRNLGEMIAAYGAVSE